VKLTDFGLARFIDRSAPELTTRCGSEAYAAPELLIAGGRPYDGRETDAWACGVVLYALATQHMPFDGGRISRIVAGVYTWPEDEMTPEEEAEKALQKQELMGTDIGRSRGLRRTVARLLVRNPKERARVMDVCGPEWPAEEDVNGGDVERVRNWFAGVVPEVNVEGLPMSDHDSECGDDGHDEDECDFTDDFPSSACGHLVDRAGIASIASEEVPWLS
jgi:serine/threonine protein kinase